MPKEPKKPKPPKITFKKYPKPTGLAAVGHSRQSVKVQINKKTFAVINAPNWMTKDNMYCITGYRLFKEDEENPNPNCNFKQVTFKGRHESEQDARDWCLANLPKWLENNTPHFFGD